MINPIHRRRSHNSTATVRMSDSNEESFMILQNMKKRKLCDNQNYDRLKSLTLTSTTLQILSLLPNVLEVKHHFLSEVNISTDFPNCFNLKQVVESIKGAKIVKYRSQFAAPGSSSTTSASAAAYVAAPASAAPPNLHLCRAEKDDTSSNEDKVEKHQL
ncbi:hypothetical protein P8452_33187 [Trifolium repens]|nr:hypothetical protein P8452_33187 [Trifolium repens]